LLSALTVNLVSGRVVIAVVNWSKLHFGFGSNEMTYKTKVKPYAHQKKGNAKMRGRRVFALLMAMRTGKTKVELDDFGEMELAGAVKDQLVIAPGGVYRTWNEAIETHCSDDLRDRMLVHTWRSGAGKKDGLALEKFLKTIDPKRPRTLLMNIEALSSAKQSRLTAIEFLRQRPGLTLTTIDEATTIKNKSIRTKFVNGSIAPLSYWRRILSGLATPRSPLDLFYEFEFLDWEILGFRNWYSFRSHIAFMKIQYLGGRSVNVVDVEQGDKGFRPEAIKELQELIGPHSFRVEFRPKIPSTWSIVEVEMTEEQAKAYVEMKEFATTKLSKSAHVTATVVIAQMMKMHQILCGHVKDEEQIKRELPENKTKSVVDFLEDYAGKAIIWCSYDYNIRKLAEHLRKTYGNDSVACFWGANQKTRDDDVKRFKNDPRCRFMLSTPDAGGRGQTWDVADLVIYFSSKDNLEHRDQSEQRAMGVSKNKQVDFVDFIYPESIEIKILEALRAKITMSSTINGDNYKEWLI